MNSPFPNLPYLLHGDRVVTESEAILFYLSGLKSREDLFGADFEERLLLLQLRGVWKDINSEVIDVIYNPKFNQTLVSELFSEGSFVMKKLVFLNKFLNGKSFVTGNNAKYVDFLFYEQLQMIKKMAKGVYEKFPAFEEFERNFRKLNGIENYLKSERFNENRTFSNPTHSVSNI